MSIFETFREVVKQRLQALLWRSIASEVEVESAIQDVEQLNRIEECARRYEAEGKPHLAEALRSRAASMDGNAPGGSICEAVKNVQLESQVNPSIPQLTEQPSATAPAPGKPRRKRRNANTEKGE